MRKETDDIAMQIQEDREQDPAASPAAGMPPDLQASFFDGSEPEEIDISNIVIDDKMKNLLRNQIRSRKNQISMPSKLEMDQFRLADRSSNQISISGDVDMKQRLAINDVSVDKTMTDKSFEVVQDQILNTSSQAVLLKLERKLDLDDVVNEWN